MLRAFELRTDRFQASRSFYVYLIFLISHMDRLAQWDSKVLCLNSTDGLGYFGEEHKVANACKKLQIYIYIKPPTKFSQRVDN